jgi:hypothetical protein
MDHVGIDVHRKERQVCILGEGGELREQRIRTTPERFAAVLGERPRARILLEASTGRECVARGLEGLGQIDHGVDATGMIALHERGAVDRRPGLGSRHSLSRHIAQLRLAA